VKGISFRSHEFEGKIGEKIAQKVNNLLIHSTEDQYVGSLQKLLSFISWSIREPSKMS
jgi:hypothetical protein